MDIVTLNSQINSACGQIQFLSGELDRYGRAAAEKCAEYDKQLAVTLVKLKNGEAVDFFGEKVQNPPVGTSERIAKGICYKAKMEAELAEHLYVNCQQQLKAAMAVLSGRQSQNKYLETDIS